MTTQGDDSTIPQSLSYSDLPAGSGIIVENDGQCVRITLPPKGLGRAALWMLWFVIPPLAGLILLTSAVIWFSDARRLLWSMMVVTGPVRLLKGLLLDWELAIWVAALGIATYLFGRVQVCITASTEKLTIGGKIWRWNWQKEWPRQAVTSIRCRWGEVKIYTGKRWASGIIVGLSKSESQWLARMLRQALELSPERS